MSDTKPKKVSNITDKSKKESLERLAQSYHQAKANGDTKQIKLLEMILKRLGYTKLRD